MKKIFTTLLLMVGACSLTQAQVQVEGGKTEFGIGVGYGTSYITISESNATSNAVGAFNVAASLDHYFSNRWSLKAKVVYDQKGWNEALVMGTTKIEADYKYNYITVPVMANWHFGKTRNWYLNFGPYVGFLLKAEGKASTGDTADFKPFSNTTDGGLALGIGVKLPLSDKVRFFIEYDGQGGVANIIKDSTTDVRIGRGSFNIGFNF